MAGRLVLRRGGRAVKGRNPVTIRQVAKARALMVDGYSMKEAAIIMGVRSSDLDKALWSHVGIDVNAVIGEKPRPHPMF